DEVIILASGRMAAQGKLHDLLSSSMQAVRFRSPEPERLVEVLSAANLEASNDGGVVTCKGATPATVGPIIAENQIVIHEMTSSTESLEALFFELTGGEGMQPGRGTADGRSH